MAKPAVVIADDLTGAADTGACFIRAGFNVTVVISPDDEFRADVLAYSTESRHVDENESRRKTRCILQTAGDAAFRYKKIDSMLRGFPAVELAVIMDELRVEKVLVAPALPSQGRVTVEGKQFVLGTPGESISIQDAVPCSDLVQLFRFCDRPIRIISLGELRSNPARVQKVFDSPGPAVIIGDAKTDTDLQTLAEAAVHSGVRLFCGSAGLAAALADRIPGKQPLGAPTPLPKLSGPLLIIAGSRNRATIDQVEMARDAGVPVVEIDPDREAEPGASPNRAIHAVAARLGSGQDVILATSSSKEYSLGPIAVAEQLGQYVNSLASPPSFGGLLLTGGDVAMAVLTAVNAKGIQLRGELLPGIPLGVLVGGVCSGVPVVTKSGGFGGKDAILRIIQLLRRGEDPISD